MLIFGVIANYYRGKQMGQWREISMALSLSHKNILLKGVCFSSLRHVAKLHLDHHFTLV